MSKVKLTPGEVAMLARWSLEAHHVLAAEIRSAIKHAESDDYIDALYEQHDMANALRGRLGLKEQAMPVIERISRPNVLTDIDF